MNVTFRRSDGSFVVDYAGLPYHVPVGHPWHAEALALGADAPLEPSPPAVDVPAPELSFAQLLIGLVAEEWITEAEGEAWLLGTLPAAVIALIDTLPAPQRFAARARAARPSVVLRLDPLVVALAAAQEKTSAELDAFFATYAQV